MPNTIVQSTLPIAAAAAEPQIRLPPFQQIIYTPTILISLILLGIALVVVAYMSFRARKKAKAEARAGALKLAEKILVKRGGTPEDVTRLLYIFRAFPGLDPAAVAMIKDRFDDDLSPRLKQVFGGEFASRLESLYFPPPKTTRRGFGERDQDLRTLVEERRSIASSQAAATILDIMDATLRPGVAMKMHFQNIPGSYDCLAMGHDMQAFNITLPANNSALLALLKTGTQAEGTLEDGPSLIAFTAEVMQAVAGSMPYCRLSLWKSVWEVRKRDSVRLPLTLEIDFQHISTASAGSIRMSNLDKEIGTVRPGRLVDVSLGGCCIETPSTVVFSVGDMIRFSKVLAQGNPPATLLGAAVKVDKIRPEEHDGAIQRLHVQFLVIDDVSQRILVRTIRQLQEVAAKEEWLHSQHLLQQMRRNNVAIDGSPAPGLKRDSAKLASRANAGGTDGGSGGADKKRPSIRMPPKEGMKEPVPGTAPWVLPAAHDAAKASPPDRESGGMP